MRTNKHGLPIGEEVLNFQEPSRPNFLELKGHAVRVIPLSEEHLPILYKVLSLDTSGANWTYLPYGPFANEQEFNEWAKSTCFGEDPKFYTLVTDQGIAGVSSYLRIEPKMGCIELGHIHFSPLLQRTRAATEALLLMIEWAFQAGYRRVEWKCDSLHAKSRRAAERLGFTYEGIFRHHVMYKSRNRDTVWYSITSYDWTRLQPHYRAWMHPNNFTETHQELVKLKCS